MVPASLARSLEARLEAAKKVIDLLKTEIDCDVDGPYWVYSLLLEDGEG